MSIALNLAKSIFSVFWLLVGFVLVVSWAGHILSEFLCGVGMVILLAIGKRT